MEIQQPKLRFSEFKGDYFSIALKGITTKIGDGLHSTPKYDELGNYYFINGNNLVNGVVKIFENTKKINEVEYLKNRRELTDKTILLSINGTIGSLAIYNNEKVILGKSACYINVNEENCKSFIYYILQSEKVANHFNSELTGTTIKNLSLGTINKLQVQIPSLSEQTKIASFLTSIDSKINQLTQKKSLLQEYKKGIMQKIFSLELRFKDDNGKDFEDWEEKKLGEVATKQSSNISANTIEENEGNYKIYGASGLLKKIDFYREENKYISIVKDGAGVGRTLLCEAYSSVLGTLDIIKPKVDANLYFVYSLINNIDFTKYITGSTIPHIYFKDYSKEKIKIPSLEEQNKIADFLSAIDDKINKVNTQLEQTIQYKKGLLQQMFV
jgi:type I restriction enzyme S subunit